MKLFMVLISTVFCFAVIGNDARAQGNIGANTEGTERVCVLGMAVQTEQGLQEGLARCKKGDILEIGWAKIAISLQLCDFTKTIVYHPPTGAIAACVYTGVRRGVSK